MNININGVSQSVNIQSIEDMNAFWMNTANQFTESKELIHSVLINGTETSDYADVILNNFEHIETVDIITTSAENNYYTVLVDVKSYIATVLTELEQYMKPLYSSSIEECKELPVIVESIEWIITSTNYLEHLEHTYQLNTSAAAAISEAVSKFKPVLGQLNAELETENLIGFADAVQYEFLVVVEELYSVVKEVECPEQDLVQ